VSSEVGELAKELEKEEVPLLKLEEVGEVQVELEVLLGCWRFQLELRIRAVLNPSTGSGKEKSWPRTQASFPSKLATPAILTPADTLLKKVNQA